MRVPLFYIYCLLWTTRPRLVVSHSNAAKFAIEKGIRYTCGVLATGRSRSLAECALMCAKQDLCLGFDFGSGQCDLLSAAASCRDTAPGWSHAYYQSGNYAQNSHEGSYE